jgi:acetyltransferase-like isoleucine patch superfamily enzyme
MPKNLLIGSIAARVLHKIAMIAPGGWSLRPALHRLRGVKIGRNVWISQYVYIDELHPDAIRIGDNTSIGLRSSIISHLYWGYAKSTGKGFAPVEIGTDVFIGPHCLILPGVHIGDGAVIRGGSVISRNVPAHTFWGPPEAGPIAQATVPLTPQNNYAEFLRGLRPLKRRPPSSSRKNRSGQR